MPWKKYSLYNLIGAILWGIGLTMLGYAVGYIPFIRDIVTEYIDVILLAAVAGTAIFIAIHYFRERAAAKREGAVSHAEAESLTLDPKTLEDGDQPRAKTPSTSSSSRGPSSSARPRSSRRARPGCARRSRAAPP